MDHGRKEALLYFCLFMLAISGGLTIFRWHDIKGSYLINTNALSKTAGTIRSSGIIRKNGSKTGTTYHYLIDYEFRVNDRIYRSDQVTFAPTGTKDRGFAEEYIGKYPVGKSVTVFYEEGNPSFSALEPDAKDDGFLAVLGGVFTGLPLICLVWLALGNLRPQF